MADKFTPPQMDWTSSGDVYKRFKLFRQKCEFIFEGPLEKVDESTRAQMKAITQNEDKTELHAVRSKKQSTFVKKSQGPESFKTTGATNEKSSRNNSSSNQMDASDVEANMTNPWSAQLSLPHASIVVSRVITSKCVSRRIKRFISWKLKVLLIIVQKPSMFSWEL